MPDAARTSSIIGLPGNGLLTFCMDIQSASAGVGIFRIRALMNRAFLNPDPIEVVCIRGELTEPQYKVGSTKAGVELYRPAWSFIPSVTPLALNAFACGRRAVEQVIVPTNPYWTSPVVIASHRRIPFTSPYVVCSPVFRWIDVLQTSLNCGV